MLFGHHSTPSSLSFGMGGDGLGCVVIGEDEYDVRALGGMGDGDGGESGEKESKRHFHDLRQTLGMRLLDKEKTRTRMWGALCAAAFPQPDVSYRIP